MKKVLLAEDSQMFGKIAKSRIEDCFDVSVCWMQSLAEVNELLEKENGDFVCALLDYNLPDSHNGGVIDSVLSHGITSFVFTSSVSDEVREHVWSKKVADYISKEDPNSMEYVIAAIKHLETNKDTLVLVVDDSQNSRTMLSELLYVQQFRVLNAVDGYSALEILEQYPEVKLVITTHDLPELDGYMLCQKIRGKYKKDQLSILGLSSEKEKNIGVRFLKSGADDVIVKESLLVEEFYGRVRNCLETVDLHERLRKKSGADYLTTAMNRKSFFQYGEQMLTELGQKDEYAACIVLDIDRFRNINESYGNRVGDRVLQGFANLIIEDSIKSDIIGRLEGDTFGIIVPAPDLSDVVNRMEELRKRIEASPMAIIEQGRQVYVTSSLGIRMATGESLDQMLKKAEAKLKEAKEAGRNVICY